MEQEIKKSENNSKLFWQFLIAFMVIVLVVLVGGIIIILIQGGHSISGKEVAQDASFPLILFIPIWVALARKKERPTPRQERIIKTMIIVVLILVLLNVFVFWLL